MSLEWDALQALASYWTGIAPESETALAAGQILVDYPDVDKMPYPVMLYLIPENGANEPLTVQSDLETLSMTAYLLCKFDASHKSMSDLIEEAFDYYASLATLMLVDPTAGGAFMESRIESFEFYPAITGLANSVGIEIKLNAKFERSA